MRMKSSSSIHLLSEWWWLLDVSQLLLCELLVLRESIEKIEWQSEWSEMRTRKAKKQSFILVSFIAKNFILHFLAEGFKIFEIFLPGIETKDILILNTFRSPDVVLPINCVDYLRRSIATLLEFVGSGLMCFCSIS